MKKYIFLIVLCGFCTHAFCQSSEAFKLDSIRLNNLKKNLSTLKDSARVDLLNSIAIKSIFNAAGSPRVRIDTCLYYASIAYKEAVKLNYKSGRALALLLLNGIEAAMNQPGKDEAAKEKNIRAAIRLGEESNDNIVLGYGYYYLPVKNDFDKHVDYSKKAIDYFLKAGDTLHAAEISNWLVGDYEARGEYEEAFDYCKKALDLSKKSGTDFSMNWQQFLVQFSLESMSGLYSAAGDYETAMKYIKENERYGKSNKTDWNNFDAAIADLYCTMSKYDTALVYANRLSIYVPPARFPRGSSIFGQIYLNGTKEYDKAIAEFRRCIDTGRKYLADSVYSTAKYLIYTGQAYDGKKDYIKALQFAKQGLGYAEEKSQRPIMMHGYQALSTIYHHLGNNDSAYMYLQKYMVLKDSIQNKQSLLRMYNSRKEAEDNLKSAELGFLQKDNEIKQQQLRQEGLIKNFLLLFLIVLLLAGFFIFRSLNLKRKNEKLKSGKQHAELQEKATRLEMQALRAQMNPHFIFNCLSSINCFILENNTEKASDYLTRFSRLIRMVLTNSEKPLITLEEELKMLGLYLDMERLRFENSFDYNITYTNDVDAASVLVPPLLLQPFCENAIWHGLRHKDDQGHLNIAILKEKEFLTCIITDDGVGRTKAAELNTLSAKKEKSMGLKITTERLSLFNHEKALNSFYEMTDVIDESGAVTGTKVSIKIRHRNLMEAVA